jgi:hypothetical protein
MVGFRDFRPNRATPARYGKPYVRRDGRSVPFTLLRASTPLATVSMRNSQRAPGSTSS